MALRGPVSNVCRSRQGADFDATFEDADSDGDGRISLAEFVAAARRLGQPWAAPSFPRALAYAMRGVLHTHEKLRRGDGVSAGAARLDLNFQSYWTTAVPCHTERWWYPFLIHIEPTHWWWFLTELAEKTWINYLYLRGNNSDENFNWKLAVRRAGLGRLGGSWARWVLDWASWVD